MTSPDQNGMTYRTAGVDIEAGDALVERIKPLARATDARRRDGRARRLRRAVRPARGRVPRPGAGQHHGRRRHQAAASRSRPGGTTRSASTWWRCASTTWWCRAPSRCSSWTISPPARLRSSRPRRWSPASPRAAAGRLRAGRRRDRRDAGHVCGRRLRPGRLQRRRRRARTRCCRGAVQPGDTVLGLPSSGVHSNGYSLVRRVDGGRAALGWDDTGAVRGRAELRRRADGADPHLRAAGAGAAPGRAAAGGGAHHRRRPAGQPAARAAAGAGGRAGRRRAGRCRRCSAGWRAAGGVAAAEMLRVFNCGVGMALVVRDAAAAQAHLLADRGAGGADRPHRRSRPATAAARVATPSGWLD